jgi:hypothetical protein
MGMKLGFGAAVTHVAGRPLAASAPVTHIITASAGAHGSISPSGAVEVNHGANQEFTFGADSGYHVTSLTVDGEAASSTSPYTFTNVTAEHTIAVAFAVNEPVRTVENDYFDATGSSDAVTAAAGDLLVLAIVADITTPDVGFRLAAAWGSQSFVAGPETGFNADRGWISIHTLVVSEGNAGTHAVVPDWVGSDGDTPEHALGSLERWSGTVDATPGDGSAIADNYGTTPDSGETAVTAQAHEIALCAIGWSAVPATKGTWDSGYSDGVGVGSGLYLSTAYRILTATGTARARKSGVSAGEWGALCGTFKVGP